MTYLAVNQYGDTVKLYTKYPRKELLEQLYTTHADKMYIDTKSGDSKHVGYVIQGNWYTLYKVSEFNK